MRCQSALDGVALQITAALFPFSASYDIVSIAVEVLEVSMPVSVNYSRPIQFDISLDVLTAIASRHRLDV
ncbi:hypothetical protein NCPPB3778_49 [Rathayibacter phage NCPPB3778]|nr:hypothetical protein NCPPB3778_49 [Rathayibacter phage NCPPB3778]